MYKRNLSSSQSPSLRWSRAGVVAARGFAAPTAHAATPSAPAPSGATLTFRRIFKSSSPEFIEISVREDSDEATYEIRQLDDDPGAAKFEVSSGLRAKMFAFAQQLNRRMKYDRLGINDALLQFETELNRKLLPEPSVRSLRWTKSPATPASSTSVASAPAPWPNASAAKADQHSFTAPFMY